jgi:hypothetical protein
MGAIGDEPRPYGGSGGGGGASGAGGLGGGEGRPVHGVGRPVGGASSDVDLGMIFDIGASGAGGRSPAGANPGRAGLAQEAHRVP